MLNIEPYKDGYIIAFSTSEDREKFFKVKNKKFILSVGWTVPNLDEIESIFHIEENKQIVNECKDMGKFLKLEPYSYQKEAIKFCLDNPKALLVLPCGAGKTAILIGVFDEMVRSGFITNKGLIVVKSSLKYQWAKEVEKFSNYSVNIIKTKSELCLNEYNRIKSREKKLKKLKVMSSEYKAIKQEISEIERQIEEKFLAQFNYELLITNYESVKNDDIKNALHKLKLEFVAADEVHSIKSYKAERSKAMYEFGDVKVTIGATATPVQKNYEDIFGLFKFVNSNLWTTFSKFAALYIKYSRPGIVSGFRNIDNLREKISPYLFVKTKEEISSQLPTLNVIQRYCTLDDKIIEKIQEILDEISELHEQERQIIAKCPNEHAIETNPELKQIEAKIMALQTFAQELSDEPELLMISDSEISKNYYVKSKNNKKMELLYSMVEEIIDSGEKVCIFSRFERMQAIIADNLSSIKYKDDNDGKSKNIQFAFINGTMDGEHRYDEVYNKFRDNDNYKVLLASDAGSTG